MEYAEDYEVSPDGYTVPDAPHMEIMFDALEHTAAVEGTESLPRFNNLTQAQHYAVAVLDANGIKYGMRAGNEEGVFSAIGNGFKAVWDYIKKTFTSIWNFFFNRDAAKEGDEAKEAIDEKNEELKKAEAGTQTDEQANAQATKLAGQVDGKEAEALKAAKTPAEKKKAIKDALKKMGSMSGAAKKKLEGTVGAAVKAKKAFLSGSFGSAKGDAKQGAAAAKLADKDHAAAHLLVEMSSEVAKFSMGEANFLKSLEGATSINTPQAAVAFGEAAKKNIDALKALASTFNAKKGKIQSLITATEAKMKKAKDASDKKSLQSEIAAMRTVMVGATQISKLIHANFTRVTAAHKDLVGVFGL